MKLRRRRFLCLAGAASALPAVTQEQDARGFTRKTAPPLLGRHGLGGC
jgi:hypothetical protein